MIFSNMKTRFEFSIRLRNGPISLGKFHAIYNRLDQQRICSEHVKIFYPFNDKSNGQCFITSAHGI
jgi:hypothetical protein